MRVILITLLLMGCQRTRPCSSASYRIVETPNHKFQVQVDMGVYWRNSTGPVTSIEEARDWIGVLKELYCQDYLRVVK